jgi:hypothetical protein
VTRFNQALTAIVLILLAVALGMTIRFGYRNGGLIHAILWNTKDATYNVADVSGVLKDTSTEDKKILGEVSELVKLTNVQFYGKSGHPGLVPQLTTLATKAQPVADNLAAAAGHLDQAIVDLDTLIKTGSVSLEELQESQRRIDLLIADVDAQVTDPHVKQLLADLADAVRDGAKATNQFAAIATDGRQIADKARETYLKPVNLWWGLVKTLLPLAGSAAQIVK